MEFTVKMSDNTTLSLQNLSFSFGKTNVINDVCLDVTQGSFTTLLGPSGCGKTTLLRLISGFLEPTEGKVLINGLDQKGIAPNLRHVGMVFQDYALFPHMTVEQNMLYGLKLNNKNKEEYNSLIQHTSRILALTGLLHRYPHELSGGQQQRVALGRALILKPSILLMDEPLSSLDTKLRTQVREELLDIQKALNITTIYVTHDQDEALSMSDNIAVVNLGSLQQTGTPQKIYFEPENKFVADFVGRANFINKDDKLFMARPEWITLYQGDNSTDPQYTGIVVSSLFLGSTIRYRVKTNLTASTSLIADMPSDSGNTFNCGSTVSIKIKRKWAL